MIPVIALVGRPNVGKSTLFNRLTKSRDALVANFSGLTRDRQYGDGVFQEQKFVVVDTGGLSGCLLYTSPSPRDRTRSRMPSSA